MDKQMFVKSIKKFHNPIFRSEYNFKLNERTLAVKSINIKSICSTFTCAAQNN